MFKISTHEAARLDELWRKQRRAKRKVDELQRALGQLADGLMAVEKAVREDPEVRVAMEDRVRREPLERCMDITDRTLRRMYEVMPIRRRDDGPTEKLIN